MHRHRDLAQWEDAESVVPVKQPNRVPSPPPTSSVCVLVVTGCERELPEELVDEDDPPLRTRADLTSRVEALEGELNQARHAYQSLDAEAHRVYWVAGTRDELLQRGVVREEGGARVLFLLWRRGETLVPARDLDPAQFDAVDLRETRELALPRPDARYRVVSRHDGDLLEGTRVNGALTGASIRITDPERFWQASPFLILVERGS
jgi:hypothetical protein